MTCHFLHKQILQLHNFNSDFSLTVFIVASFGGCVSLEKGNERVKFV